MLSNPFHREGCDLAHEQQMTTHVANFCHAPRFAVRGRGTDVLELAIVSDDVLVHQPATLTVRPTPAGCAATRSGAWRPTGGRPPPRCPGPARRATARWLRACLLYTSDAAD